VPQAILLEIGNGMQVDNDMSGPSELFQDLVLVHTFKYWLLDLPGQKGR
jgi:hypothetical protein